MGLTNSLGVAGIGASKAITFGQISASGDLVYKPAGGLMRGAKCRDPFNADDVFLLQIGTLMARHSTDLTYAPWIIGVVITDAVAAATTTYTISVASAVELVRRVGASGNFVITGPPGAAGVVVQQTVAYSAVNVTTGVVTHTATGVAFVVGSFISETIYPIPFTFTGDDNPAIIPATGDRDFARIPMAGTVNPTQLRNWPSDTSLRLWIKQRLSTLAGNKFVFVDSI